MGGSVYAFAGGKGGVGKTTTTANVAIALSKKGFDVAAVDADVGMTNLGEFLGLTAENGGIHDVLAGRADVEDVVIEGPAGVAVVPGGEDISANGDADPSNLRRVVDPLRGLADVVLLDTGAGISHQNIIAYGLSDGLLLVTTADRVAVADADKTADLADRVECPVVGTVVTRAVGETDLAAFEDDLAGDVVAAIPAYDRPAAPEPRVLEAPDCPATGEYRRLATTVAVCHQTGDFGEAARAASDALELPEDDGDDRDDEDPGGLFGGLFSVLPVSR